MDAGLDQLRTDAPLVFAQRVGHCSGTSRVAAVGEPFPKSSHGIAGARDGPMMLVARKRALVVVDPQVFRKRTHFSCIYGNRKIISDGGCLWVRGSGIRLADRSVEKEKARRFPDWRAFPKSRTAARPVVIRVYPSRKKDPVRAVTPQAVPLSAPRLENKEQPVQMSRSAASSGEPVLGRNGPGAPQSASRFDRQIMPAAAVTRRRAHRPGSVGVLAELLWPLRAWDILVHVRRDGGHDPSVYPTLTSRGVHPSLVEPWPTSVIRYSRSPRRVIRLLAIGRARNHEVIAVWVTRPLR